MVAPLAVGTAIKGLGVLAAAGAAGAALLLPAPRLRAVAALSALVLTPVLLLGELWGSPQLTHLRDRPGLAIGVATAAVAAVAAFALAIRLRPELLPLLAVAALPFRIPVETGGESANLLVPLYLVVVAGVLAYAAEQLRPRVERDATAGDGAASGWRDAPAGRLEVVLVAAVVLYALQSLYSSDFEQALKNAAFFYIPFALLFRVLTAVRWPPRVVRGCFYVAVGEAVLFAGIGFVEYGTRELLWNRKVIESNQFESYFRVNSLFFDPNIYGRFLMVVMLGLAATLLWPRRTREVGLASAALAVLWAGLVLTFSQSSFAALLVGLGVLAALRVGMRPVAYVAAAVAVGMLAVLIAAPGLIHLNLSSKHSVNRASSGRAQLVRGGLSMFADRPIWGLGSGSFAERYRAREHASSREAASASHTIPITVAAEQGVVGLAVYGLVLWAAFTLLFRGLGPLRRRGPPQARLVTRAYVAAAFGALVFHTLLYAAFLEDPITWTLLAAGVVLARAAAPVRRAEAQPPASLSARASSSV